MAKNEKRGLLWYGLTTLGLEAMHAPTFWLGREEALDLNLAFESRLQFVCMLVFGPRARSQSNGIPTEHKHYTVLSWLSGSPRPSRSLKGTAQNFDSHQVLCRMKTCIRQNDKLKSGIIHDHANNIWIQSHGGSFGFDKPGQS